MRYMGRAKADIGLVRGDGGKGRLIVNMADEPGTAYRIVKSVHRSDPVNARRVPLQL